MNSGSPQNRQRFDQMLLGAT